VTGFYGMGLYIINQDADEDAWLHFHHPDGRPSFVGARDECPLDHATDVDLDAVP